ncbi:hypothetical protein HNQ56_002301 [Anaerotaenia torta]
MVGGLLIIGSVFCKQVEITGLTRKQLNLYWRLNKMSLTENQVISNQLQNTVVGKTIVTGR